MRTSWEALALSWTRSLFLGFLILVTVGCDQREGSVEVDVGTAPLAAAYRVDLYAAEPGLDLVEGVWLVEDRVTTLDKIPAGRWALLIQAQNGDLTTIGHYQARLEVFPDKTTRISAGTYKPGMPGDAPPESEASFTSFGPNGDALLSALHGAPADSAPAATVELELGGGGEASQPVNNLAVLRRSGPSERRCGTNFISTADLKQADQVLRQATIRPQISTVAPGATHEFFVVTTFRNVACQRLLNDSQTQNCLIFAEVVGGTPVISETTALSVAQAFDFDNPFQNGDNGIYADTRARFGSEWTLNGGRDGDPRVVLVFLSPDSIGGEGLFGFFNPADQSDSGSSNRGEILYLNANRANTDLYDVLGTIAHEFSHLILYNQKVVQNGAFPEGASSENSVLDEGLAVLNEELCGFSFTGDQGGNFFMLSAVSRLLEEGLNRPYFQFGGQLSDYGAGYLFWRYVHDQLGVDAIRTLATSTQTGRANFDAVLDESFTSFFQRYTQAVALNGQAGVPENLQFKNLSLSGSFQSRNNTSFQLHGLQGINTLTLPGTVATSVELEPWGSVFYRISGGDGSGVSWKAAGADGMSVGVVPIVNAK